MTALDPATWPAAEVADYLARSLDTRDTAPVTGAGDRAVVVGSTGPFAQLAGRRALAAGGSATDAVLATALAQIALAAGSWVSYAGVFTMVHFAAGTGEVSSLSAGFATFAGETEPATIPARPTPSGRTALVPGFPAGAWAAHQRFGTLPWSDLCRPAIHVAEHGFPVGTAFEQRFLARADVLSGTPEAAAVFFDGDRPRVRTGEPFRQPRLADTLRQLAAHGADWMYRGTWARRFVDVVRRHGGRADAADLAGYRPVWAPPATADHHGHRVYTVGRPDRGGTALVQALNLLTAANLGDHTTDPEALYWLIQIGRQTAWAGADPDAETDPDRARDLWHRMRAAGRFVGPGTAGAGSHSDFVLAADEHGNVAAACHSINTSLWGGTGLFVDGVSIPDAASFQQAALATLGPGDHLPFPANPALALRDGRPVLASGSIGAGLQLATLQGLHSTLALGVPVADAVRRPFFHAPDYLTGETEPHGTDAASLRHRINRPPVGARFRELAERARHDGVPPGQVLSAVLAAIPQVVEDGFDHRLLAAVEALGQPLSVRPVSDPTIPRGFWGALALHPDRPRLRAGRTPFSGGLVEGL